MLLRMSKATALEASAKPRPQVLQLAVQLATQSRDGAFLSSALGLPRCFMSKAKRAKRVKPEE